MGDSLSRPVALSPSEVWWLVYSKISTIRETVDELDTAHDDGGRPSPKHVRHELQQVEQLCARALELVETILDEESETDGG